jgi:hypothetical protein
MIEKGKMITGADIRDQKDELGLGVVDDFWLYGMLIRPFRFTGPKSLEPISNSSLTVLARYLDRSPELNPVPEMPEVAEIYEKIEELYKGRLSSRKFGCLFGASGWSGNRWLYHNGEPSPTVKRIFYMLLKAIEENGPHALEEYLSVLEEEAYARGFENGLQSVLKTGSWKITEKDQEERKTKKGLEKE